MLVAVTVAGEKETASTDGMGHTQDTSPYYAAWVHAAPAIYEQVRAAVLARDFDALGPAVEHSALAMHASMLAARPALIYFAPAHAARDGARARVSQERRSRILHDGRGTARQSAGRTERRRRARARAREARRRHAGAALRGRPRRVLGRAVTLARAPGKLVLSGAYAVLSGAPALVVAVDRYVLADSARPADFLTPEVHAALGERAAPWFDASQLRDGDKKLGFGSSAAILVASLAALELATEPALSDAALCERVYERAFVAHRAAQGGGSGVDVAASAHGGRARRAARGPARSRSRGSHLPSGARVRGLGLLGGGVDLGVAGPHRRICRARSSRARARISAQAEAAESALDATERGNAADFVRAIARQVTTLSALGEAAGVSIVTAGAGRAGTARCRARRRLLAGGRGRRRRRVLGGRERRRPRHSRRVRSELGLSRGRSSRSALAACTRPTDATARLS